MQKCWCLEHYRLRALEGVPRGAHPTLCVCVGWRIQRRLLRTQGVKIAHHIYTRGCVCEKVRRGGGGVKRSDMHVVSFANITFGQSTMLFRPLRKLPKFTKPPHKSEHALPRVVGLERVHSTVISRLAATVIPHRQSAHSSSAYVGGVCSAA